MREMRRRAFDQVDGGMARGLGGSGGTHAPRNLEGAFPLVNPSALGLTAARPGA